MGDFDINYSDVDSVQNEVNRFRQAFETACGDGAGSGGLTQSIDNLAKCESFKGRAAKAVKNYFLEVHKPLAASMNLLLRELLIEYTEEFSNKFLGNPLEEKQYSARWESSYLDSVLRKLDNILNGDIHQADSNAQIAQSYCEGFGIHAPYATTWKSKVGAQKNYVARVRNAVGNIDDHAARSFMNSNARINELRTQIAQAIAFCNEPSFSVIRYERGDFDSSLLNKAALASIEYVEERWGDTMLRMHESLAREIKLNEQREAEAQNLVNAAGWGVVVGVLAEVVISATCKGGKAGVKGVSAISKIMSKGFSTKKSNKMVGKIKDISTKKLSNEVAKDFAEDTLADGVEEFITSSLVGDDEEMRESIEKEFELAHFVNDNVDAAADTLEKAPKLFTRVSKVSCAVPYTLINSVETYIPDVSDFFIDKLGEYRNEVANYQKRQDELIEQKDNLRTPQKSEFEAIRAVFAA